MTTVDLHRSPVVSGHPTAALPRFPTRTALSGPSLHLRDPKRGWAERPDPARTASNVCGGREGALLSSCEVTTRRLTARGPGPRVPPPSWLLHTVFCVSGQSGPPRGHTQKPLAASAPARELSCLLRSGPETPSARPASSSHLILLTRHHEATRKFHTSTNKVNIRKLTKTQGHRHR